MVPVACPHKNARVNCSGVILQQYPASGDTPTGRPMWKTSMSVLHNMCRCIDKSSLCPIIRQHSGVCSLFAVVHLREVSCLPDSPNTHLVPSETQSSIVQTCLSNKPHTVIFVKRSDCL